jgi:hypothetical protein
MERHQIICFEENISTILVSASLGGGAGAGEGKRRKEGGRKEGRSKGGRDR